ncbi:MAG TPA: metallophosphoesterase family protein [Anaeromyxobacteraceae bacterium]|jgi:putative phosphoesterase
MRVGLVADTHGLADPRLERLFRGCALILHAGDVTGPAVLEALAAIAPVRAARGNNDLGPFGESLPLTLREGLGRLSALVVHELWAPGRLSAHARAAFARERPDVVVFGHSHRAGVEVGEGVLYLNPGSAGPRRFHLPRSAAVLEVRGRSAVFTVHDLERHDLGPLLEPYRAAL